MSNFAFQLHLFRDPKFPDQVPGMTADERAEFVKGLMDGSIFTSMHIHELDKKKGELGKVFLAQGAGQFMRAPHDVISNIGVLWEFMREKGQNAHKGSASKVLYPTFLSVRVCSTLDWDLACDVIKALKAETNIVRLG